MEGHADNGHTTRVTSTSSLGSEYPDPRYPHGVLKQQRHLVTSRRYTSPTPPENQPTDGCPHGYADWCLAREIVKTVKTAILASILPPLDQCARRSRATLPRAGRIRTEISKLSIENVFDLVLYFIPALRHRL